MDGLWYNLQFFVFNTAGGEAVIQVEICLYSRLYSFSHLVISKE